MQAVWVLRKYQIQIRNCGRQAMHPLELKASALALNALRPLMRGSLLHECCAFLILIILQGCGYRALGMGCTCHAALVQYLDILLPALR